MTSERLDEIRARCEKASPGPWRVSPDLRPDIVNEKVRKAKNELERAIRVYDSMVKKDQIKFKNGAMVFSPPGSGYWGEGQIVKDMSKSIGYVCELAKYWSDNHSNIDDAEFIAHAREDIPALLAEIDRLHGLLADRQVKEAGCADD